MTTYAELVQNIKDFMEDDGTEFSNEIDKFIDLAELRISRDVITPEFKRKVTSAFSANDPFLTMPTDLVTLEHLQVINSNVRTLLLLKSDEFITNTFQQNSDCVLNIILILIALPFMLLQRRQATYH